MEFSIPEAQRILDSLEARGDWQQAAVLRAVQAERIRQHFIADSTFAAAQLNACDSTLNATRSDNRTLIVENDRAKDNVRWWSLAAFLVGLIVGVIAN